MCVLCVCLLRGYACMHVLSCCSYACVVEIVVAAVDGNGVAGVGEGKLGSSAKDRSSFSLGGDSGPSNVESGAVSEAKVETSVD